jgi:hypothetical protein
MMARKPKYDDEVKDQARALRASGLTRNGVRTALASAGIFVSVGWLSDVFKETPPRPVKATGAPVAVAADDDDDEDDATPSQPGDAATLDDVRRDLGRLVEVLRGMLDNATGEDVCPECGRGAANVDVVTKIGRVLASATGIIAKHQPKAPPDPNANPDMIACARKAREKLHEMIDRKRRSVA